jgi:hypothetical protein
MSTSGTYTDFKFYEEEYFSGQVEVLAQNLDVFNGSSRNAIVMRSQKLKGLYEKQSFFPFTSGLISRRDPTADTGVSAINLTMDESVAVKVNRRMGPVEGTMDEWRKIGETSEMMSYVFGRQVASAKMEDYLASALLALRGSVHGTSDLLYDATDGTLEATDLVEGMFKLGDRQSRIVVWVMHSNKYKDLVKDALSNRIYEEAGMVIYGGSPGTLGRPVVVTDSDSLYYDAASGEGYDTEYVTYGLTEGAVLTEESEAETVVSDVVVKRDNIKAVIQGEYAFNLQVKGFKWGVSTGGANPTDASVASSANWSQIATSVKDCAGVAIKSQ